MPNRIVAAASLFLCGSAAWGQSRVDPSEYARLDIPALDRTVHFSPSDWDATTHHTLDMTMSPAEGGKSFSFGSEWFGKSRASLVGESVTSSQKIFKITMNIPGKPTEVYEGNPLYVAKFVATLGGKILSREFVAGKKTEEMTKAGLDGIREDAISDEAIRSQVALNFGFLRDEIKRGSTLGGFSSPALRKVLEAGCGLNLPALKLRALGEWNGAIIGRLDIKTPSSKHCGAVEIHLVQAVDAKSGRPIAMTLEMSGDDVTDGVTTHMKMKMSSDYSYVKDRAAPLDQASPIPSVEACRASSNNTSGIHYPEASKAKREQGRVLLELRVAPDGTVDEVNLQKSSGYPKLDEWALAGAHGWTFDPTTCAGVTLTFPIDFKLPDAAELDGN